jgi:hypothetical protein
MRPNNPFKKVNNYSTLPFASTCSASNVQDFIDKVVKPQFAEKASVIKATHETIVKYLLKDDTDRKCLLKDEVIKKCLAIDETLKKYLLRDETIKECLQKRNPIYFLRLYGSFGKAKYDELRRGFLTEYPNGTRMAFCDNFFARIFVAMKLAGIPYTDDDLFEYLSQQNLICGFGSTKDERILQYYSNKGAIKVNLQGLYLAHIKPTGENLEGKSISSIFLNPDRNDWDPNRKLRDILSTKGRLKDLTSKELKFLIAHFVRLIHPLNSFFVPNTNHLSYLYGKKTKHLIGEEEDLIVCVQEYLKKTFPVEYALFDSISLKCDFNCACGQNHNIKDIHWDMSILQKENEDESQGEINECKDANEDQSDNKDAALKKT